MPITPYENGLLEVPMYQMFYGATAFNQDIGSWNTSAVTTMTSMFQGATNFNQDISRKTGTDSNWDDSSTSNDYWYTGSVTTGGMNYMFNGASAFAQDLDNWCVSGVTGTPTAFGYTATGKVPLFGATGAGQCPQRDPLPLQ